MRAAQSKDSKLTLCVWDNLTRISWNFNVRITRRKTSCRRWKSFSPSCVFVARRKVRVDGARRKENWLRFIDKVPALRSLYWIYIVALEDDADDLTTDLAFLLGRLIEQNFQNKKNSTPHAPHVSHWQKWKKAPTTTATTKLHFHIAKLTNCEIQLMADDAKKCGSINNRTESETCRWLRVRLKLHRLKRDYRGPLYISRAHGSIAL